MKKNITLTLTEEEFVTITSMVDFATWTAADGMSPAMTEAMRVEYEAAEYTNPERYAELYDIQKERVDAVRKAIGLSNYDQINACLAIATDYLEVNKDFLDADDIVRITVAIDTKNLSVLKEIVDDYATVNEGSLDDADLARIETALRA